MTGSEAAGWVDAVAACPLQIAPSLSAVKGALKLFYNLPDKAGQSVVLAGRVLAMLASPYRSLRGGEEA